VHYDTVEHLNAIGSISLRHDNVDIHSSMDQAASQASRIHAKAAYFSPRGKLVDNETDPHFLI